MDICTNSIYILEVFLRTDLQRIYWNRAGPWDVRHGRDRRAAARPVRAEPSLKIIFTKL